jgi:aminoglycoside 6'-N-acetyltransferase I
MEASDRPAWAEMRTALWPEDDVSMHAQAIDAILAIHDTWGFVAETPDGAPAGLAELSVRKYANGCESQPVAFLEGIWVAPQYRRQGIGAALVAHIAAFASSARMR